MKKQKNKIPEGWKKIELNGNIKLSSGKRAKGGALLSGEVASLGGEHIGKNGKIIWKKMKFIPKDFYNDLRSGHLQIGDILLVKDGATTGKVAFARELKYNKSAVNEHVFIIRTNKKKIDSKFLFYKLYSTEGQVEIKKNFHGMIGGVKTSDIQKITMMFPISTKEQEAISLILSEIDKTIENSNEVIEKIERIKKGVMQKVLVKGINNKKFKNVKIGLNFYEIPEKWEVQNLSSTSTLKGRIGWQGLTRKEYLNEGNYYLITGTDFKDDKVKWETCYYVDKERYDQDENIQVKENDILITKDGSIGKIAFVENLPRKATLNSGIFVIRPLNKEYIPRFIYYIMKSHFFDSFMNVIAGSTIAHLYQRDFVNFEFPLPSLPEQKRITEILSTIDERLELERKRKGKLERLKKGLMNELLTGNKRVNVEKILEVGK